MKRVLFVDDDVMVLDGLRARMHALRHGWDMVFVESGVRALAEMEQHAFDVIVTDMRMPGMDGAQLLRAVSERWPQTIRIVLSGYAELEQTARLVPIAHQYLSKPSDAQELENVISRCTQLHELLREPRLRQAVGRVHQVPALPRTYARLQEVMANPDASVADMARAVGADSAIAAKVLQVVNSAFFRRAKQITKIEQAVTHLGFAPIRNIALSVEVFSKWPARLPRGFDPEQLQANAHRVAAVAQALAVTRPAKDQAMLAGLLHNIGYWILAQQCSEQLEQAAQLALERGLPMHAAELEVLGASHAEVGAYLLGMWGLPYTVIEAVALQHAPKRAAQHDFDVLAALVTARQLVLQDTPGTFGNIEHQESGMVEAYLRDLKAPFDLLEAQTRAQRALGELQS